MLWPHLDRGRPCLLPERTCLGCPMIVEGLVSNLGQNFNVLAKSSMLALFLATAACGSDGYSWGIGGPRVPGGGSGSVGSGSGGPGVTRQGKWHPIRDDGPQSHPPKTDPKSISLNSIHSCASSMPY